MRGAGNIALLLLALAAGPAGAAAPDHSPRPESRPAARVVETGFTPRMVLVPVFYHTGTRPRPRPGEVSAFEAAPAPTVFASTAAAVSPLAVVRSRRPLWRPHGLPERRQAALRVPAPVQGRSGPDRRICGDHRIRGRTLSPIVGRLRGCGIRNPVRVTSVDGVNLSQPATMNCEAARALRDWVGKGLKPAVGNRGGGVARLRVAAHYACRTRNSRPGAKLSEHARGNAIDISGVGLRDGYEITVLTGWHNRRESNVLRRAHRAACGPFGTVLGPNSDRHHQDHFHLDVARHRSGPYCR
ncbi:extensin-like protein [Maritimibacter sp. 55A14]|uniref:extensin-like domain-containing protein n=1 Tax=Maritimibacter sp. 55A14 TaxID=2174844 RepID=UPI000D612360|nr:extensin family protein [Maritimibacter sp. 55A14]PWE32152.1 extensin-like protein [Maritimibacter sp. 55A14]